MPNKEKKHFPSSSNSQIYPKKHLKNINVQIFFIVKDGHVAFNSFKVITIPLKEVIMSTVLLITPILFLSKTKNILRKLKKAYILLTSG
jgi:hypothetical protein